jgi:hypothetical protein
MLSSQYERVDFWQESCEHIQCRQSTWLGQCYQMIARSALSHLQQRSNDREAGAKLKGALRAQKRAGRDT